MINDIMTGISIKLHELFGDNYKIYTETVKQGLKEPCFLIKLISSELDPLIGRRKILNNAFCITYIPDEDNSKKQDINEIQCILLANMEFIKTVENILYLGSGIRTEVVDGVLHFFVNYDCTAIIECEKDIPYMEELNVKEEARNGI